MVSWFTAFKLYSIHLLFKMKMECVSGKKEETQMQETTVVTQQVQQTTRTDIQVAKRETTGEEGDLDSEHSSSDDNTIISNEVAKDDVNADDVSADDYVSADDITDDASSNVIDDITAVTSNVTNDVTADKSNSDDDYTSDAASTSTLENSYKAPPQEFSESEIDDRAPLFLVPLFDQVVEQGETVILETKVDGDPMPKVKWFLDGRELNDRKLFDFVYSPDGDLVLVVKKMVAEDEGEYLCMATNEYGSASSLATLTLSGV